MKGFIQVIKTSDKDIDFYNIRTTQTPAILLQKIDDACPFDVFEVALFRTEKYKSVEKKIHKKYKSNLKHSSWFTFTFDEISDALEYTKKLCEENGGALLRVSDDMKKIANRTKS